MTRVDQFESVFRSAVKEVYSYRPVEIERVLVVTDLGSAESAAFLERMRGFLGALGDDPEWSVLDAAGYGNVSELLSIVERDEPDLVCTYRNLKSSAWRWPYSLGEYLDVLAQIAPCPVLVAPHPEAGRAYDHALVNTDVVMAVTNHLTGDARLVDAAVHFTATDGLLLMTHIEDGASFERLMEAVSKVPSIETQPVRDAIVEQLLKEPRDYVESCRKALAEVRGDLRTQSLITMGHQLTEYRRFIDEHQIDLLVFHTKDRGQLAMHGLAYSLAVEVREIPLLML